VALRAWLIQRCAGVVLLAWDTACSFAQRSAGTCANALDFIRGLQSGGTPVAKLLDFCTAVNFVVAAGMCPLTVYNNSATYDLTTSSNTPPLETEAECGACRRVLVQQKLGVQAIQHTGHSLRQLVMNSLQTRVPTAVAPRPITAVRLVLNGTVSTSEGRLEVQRGRLWGTVSGQSRLLELRLVPSPLVSSLMLPWYNTWHQANAASNPWLHTCSHFTHPAACKCLARSLSILLGHRMSSHWPTSPILPFFLTGLRRLFRRPGSKGRV